MSESSSLPMAPSSRMSDGEGDEEEEEELGYEANQGTMTNADFRRMVMAAKTSSKTSEPTELESAVSQSVDDLQSREDAASRRRKRKSMYAKLKRVEEERDAELALKYRDRAKERREKDKDDDPTDTARANSGYRAVDPNASQTMAEQRRQAMQESKFLGGDMEHTHLVKGLDYALLQKVRSDMTTVPVPEHDVEPVAAESTSNRQQAQAAPPQSDLEFKTRLGKNIHKTLFRRALPVKNELFLPGRMCYAVELDEEYTESDVPTTIIRSKADCPNVQSSAMTTNDIVIHKLTQVLSYLRGSRHDRKKMKRKDKGGDDRLPGKMPGVNDPIFADLESNYQTLPRDKAAKHQQPALPKLGNYFGATQQTEESAQTSKEQVVGGLSKAQLAAGWAVADLARLQPPSGQAAPAAPTAPTAAPRPEQPAAPAPEGAEAIQAANLKRTMQKEAISDTYMECYPGVGDDDGGYDSEEEADFSKMDRGAKKGPLKRWDFENENDYAAYMDSREAMPKAAFQYGVKMNAGRKTRRFGKGGEKDDKAKLDREWKKISNILDKKGGHREAPPAKRAR